MEKYIDDAMSVIENAHKNLNHKDYKLFLEILFEEIENIGDEE